MCACYNDYVDDKETDGFGLSSSILQSSWSNFSKGYYWKGHANRLSNSSVAYFFGDNFCCDEADVSLVFG